MSSALALACASYFALPAGSAGSGGWPGAAGLSSPRCGSGRDGQRRARATPCARRKTFSPPRRPPAAGDRGPAALARTCWRTNSAWRLTLGSSWSSRFFSLVGEQLGLDDQLGELALALAADHRLVLRGQVGDVRVELRRGELLVADLEDDFARVHLGRLGGGRCAGWVAAAGTAAEPVPGRRRGAVGAGERGAGADWARSSCVNAGRETAAVTPATSATPPPYADFARGLLLCLLRLRERSVTLPPTCRPVKGGTPTVRVTRRVPTIGTRTAARRYAR